MAIRNSHRIGKIASFQKGDRDQRSIAGFPDRATLAVRADPVVLLAQYPRVELPTIVVLLYRPCPNFLGATFLLSLGELYGTLSKK